ncbi:MAG: hypothetical protein R2854_11625 [Caldilineaceae bacterium]
MTSSLPRTTVPANALAGRRRFHRWPWFDLFAVATLSTGRRFRPRTATDCGAALSRGRRAARISTAPTGTSGAHAPGATTIYDEEAVELFIRPGDADPVDYFEFEVSPNGVLLDTTIHNPTSLRADMQADFAWDCPGIQWHAVRHDAENRWQAWPSVPSVPLVDGPLPSRWRFHFIASNA